MSLKDFVRSELRNTTLVWVILLKLWGKSRLKDRSLGSYYLSCCSNLVKKDLLSTDLIVSSISSGNLEVELISETRIGLKETFLGEYLFIKSLLERIYTKLLVKCLESRDWNLGMSKLNLGIYKLRDGIVLKVYSVWLNLIRRLGKCILILLNFESRYGRLFERLIVRDRDDLKEKNCSLLNSKSRKSLSGYLLSRSLGNSVLQNRVLDLDEKEVWYRLSWWNSFMGEYLFLKGHNEVSLRSREAEKYLRLEFLRVQKRYNSIAGSLCRYVTCSLLWYYLYMSNRMKISLDLNEDNLSLGYKYFNLSLREKNLNLSNLNVDILLKHAVKSLSDEFIDLSSTKINNSYLDDENTMTQELGHEAERKYYGDEDFQKYYDYDFFNNRLQDYEREKERSSILDSVYCEDLLKKKKMVLKDLRLELRRKEYLYKSIRSDLVFFKRLCLLRSLLSGKGVKDYMLDLRRF